MVMTVLDGLRSRVSGCEARGTKTGTEAASISVELAPNVGRKAIPSDNTAALDGSRQANLEVGTQEFEAAEIDSVPRRKEGNKNGTVSGPAELLLGWRSSRKPSPKLPSMSMSQAFPLPTLVDGSQRVPGSPSEGSQQPLSCSGGGGIDE